MSEKIYNRIAILGLGLIGGSFAKACKKFDLVNHIAAYDINQESLSLALQTHIIDNSISLHDDFSAFDLIVLATPLASYQTILQKITIANHSTLIDLGSIKDNILPKKDNIIGCHPIAGSDKTGFENADADLFINKKFIICAQNANLQKLESVKKLATKIGSHVEMLNSKTHDDIYALISHLPQFLSFVSAEFCPTNIETAFFENAFRLNNSSPKIWEEIFELNDKNIEKYYCEFFNHLADLVEDFEEEKFDKILQFPPTNHDRFDPIFLGENFPEIFFRLMIVISYLKISKIKDYQSYAGTGFKDFTSITSILNSDELKQLITINYEDIIDILESFLT